MRILITAASSRTGALLAAGLSATHHVRRTDLGAGDGIEPCELGHDQATADLVTDIEAIVHIGYAGQQGDATTLIDYCTRRTCNLLYAAANAGVERCIYISTLKLLERYEENLTVTERWRSLPSAGDPYLLACHLGEITTKEFARDRLLKVLTLRLGFPIFEEGQAATTSGQTAAVTAADITYAVNQALSSEVDAWQCVHVQSPLPRQRFLMHEAHKRGFIRTEVIP